MNEGDASAGSQTLVYESDWLASRPFFYNVRNARASHNIGEVIDLAEIEFDPEGLNDYLDAGAPWTRCFRWPKRASTRPPSKERLSCPRAAATTAASSTCCCATALARTPSPMG